MTADRHVLRAGHASVVVLGGLAGVVGGSLLPWVRSGTAERNSFETLRSAERLDVVSSATLATLLQAWYLVPMIAAVATVGLALHHVRLAVVAAVVTALLAAGCSAVVLTSQVPVGAGPRTCLLGAVVLGVGAGLYARTHPYCESCAPEPRASVS